MKNVHIRQVMKERNDYEETGFDVFISGYSFSCKRLFLWNGRRTTCGCVIDVCQSRRLWHF
nr:MAG TPA: hypothetical protein [Caudoviricetes sp.]